MALVLASVSPMCCPTSSLRETSMNSGGFENAQAEIHLADDARDRGFAGAGWSDESHVQ
jgi:hypothetical protein